MSNSNKPPCDVCGEPSTSASWDVQELESDDGVWRKFERIDKPHYGCNLHPAPRSIVYNLDGTNSTPKISLTIGKDKELK